MLLLILWAVVLLALWDDGLPNDDDFNIPPLGGTLEKLLKLPAGSSRTVVPADRTWLVRGCEKESRGDDDGEDEFAVLLAVSSLHRAANMPEYIVGSSGWTERTMMVNAGAGLCVG